MLRKLSIRNWQHNRTKTKLLINQPTKIRPNARILAISIFPLISLTYFVNGIITDIFPNISALQRDRNRLLTKKRSFDTLIMGNVGKEIEGICENKSLF